ncbi:unnamed protein product [Ectocarpus sp. 12 AP-2014]
MSGRGWDFGSGGDSQQEFTQTQEEGGLDLDEYTQVEPVVDAGAEDGEDSNRAAEPVPWGRLMRLSGGAAISLMPRPEQTQGRALNEVTLGRGKMCEVQVADRRISSKHCRIYCEHPSGHLGGIEVYVEDMSANGTWINQRMKLVRGQRRLLHSGDEISLLNPFKKKAAAAVAAAAGVANGEDKGEAEKGGGESGREEDDPELLEASTFTFVNLNRNRGASHGRAGSLSVAETLRASTVPGVSSPVLRSSASGVAGMFGGARKVEDFYDVREMIGHGTSGEVRRAINRTTGKEVAVKVIETRKFALTPGLTPKELVQEAEMLKRVDHEYIIKLEDIFQAREGCCWSREGAVYLVMDLVSGGDLFDRIVEKGVYAEDLAQELLFRVLTAVDYLHSQDIVHRDLKPENILLVGRDNDVDVKITDFGLAKRANKEGLKTFCGTPQYFAPEVLKRRNTVLGVGRYGKEADMWSVGVILYILLSGTHPFHTTTLFDQITHAHYSMTGEEWEHISTTGKDLVSKLLTESPDDRLTADQALAHPFITGRAAAAAAAAPAAAAPSGAGPANSAGAAGAAADVASTCATAAEGGANSKSTEAEKEESGVGRPAVAVPAGRGESSALPATAVVAAVADGAFSTGSERRDQGDDAVGVGGHAGRAAVAEAAAVGRSSSQDTDVSSTSGAEDASPASKESFSPTEGGGASAKPVPSSSLSSSSATARSPKDSRSASKDMAQPSPRGSVPELPPPQPREPVKAAGAHAGAGGSGQGRGRKRAKRDGGAGDKQKPPARFSQLQCVRVVSGGDQGAGAGCSSSQDAAAAEDCSGVRPRSTPAGAGSAASSTGKGGVGQAAGGNAAPRAQGSKARLNGRIAGADGPAAGTTGKRKAAAVAAAAVGDGAQRSTERRVSTRHSPRRAGRGGGGGGGGDAVSAAAVSVAAPGSLPADDEIMEYSSDDSPAKGKRARVCRARQQQEAVAAAAAAAAAEARSKRATGAQAGRKRAAVTAATPASSVAPEVAQKPAGRPNARAPPPAPKQQQQQRQQQRDTKGGKQMHLNFGGSGKLNLSKQGPPPLARASAAGGASSYGSAIATDAGERRRPSGDQAAQAAAGGAAAKVEESVGGGGPAGGSSGGTSSNAFSADGAKAGHGGGGGDSGKKSKPQRTMTHLWKRAGAGQA